MRFKKGATYAVVEDVNGFIKGLPYTIYGGNLTYEGPLQVRNWLWRLFHKPVWGIFTLDGTERVEIPLEGLKDKVNEIPQK